MIEPWTIALWILGVFPSWELIDFEPNGWRKCVIVVLWPIVVASWILFAILNVARGLMAHDK